MFQPLGPKLHTCFSINCKQVQHHKRQQQTCLVFPLLPSSREDYNDLSLVLGIDPSLALSTVVFLSRHQEPLHETSSTQEQLQSKKEMSDGLLPDNNS